MVELRGYRVCALRFNPTNLGLCRVSVHASVLMGIRAGGEGKTGKKTPLLHEQNHILKALGWRSRMSLSSHMCIGVRILRSTF